MNKLRPQLIGAALAVGLAAPLAAEAQSRLPWTGDAASGGYLQAKSETAQDALKKLVGDIDALIQKAERDRSANSRFLNDLKAAIRPHQSTWATAILDEDFSDGDYTRNPRWTPVAGRFEVAKGLVMSPRIEQQSQQSAAQLLNNLLGANSQTNTMQGAVIALDRDLPNVFALDVILRASDLRNARESAMRIGVTQGADRRGGYWVVVEPGTQPTVGLYVISRSGVRRLGVASVGGDLLAGDDVRIQWQRRDNDLIRVYVNKDKLIETTDPTYQQRFTSIVLASDGMDTTVRRVRAFSR